MCTYEYTSFHRECYYSGVVVVVISKCDSFQKKRVSSKIVFRSRCDTRQKLEQKEKYEHSHKKNRAYQGDNVKQHYMCESEDPLFVNSAEKDRAYSGGCTKTVAF